MKTIVNYEETFANVRVRVAQSIIRRYLIQNVKQFVAILSIFTAFVPHRIRIHTYKYASDKNENCYVIQFNFKRISVNNNIDLNYTIPMETIGMVLSLLLFLSSSSSTMHKQLPFGE